MARTSPTGAESTSRAGSADAVELPPPRPGARREESRREGLLLDLGGLLLGALTSVLVTHRATTVLLGGLLPESRGCLELPSLAAFALGFVALDYVQYWTHRLYHGRALWRFHLAHHTLVRMHALGAYRHSLGEYLLSPAIWCHGVLLFLLADARSYAAAVATGFLLDAYRHSSLETAPRGSLGRWLLAALITPEEHAMHHRHPEVPANYGGNLRLWDRLHGTYRAPDGQAGTYGVENRDPALRLLFGAAETVPERKGA